MIGRSRLGERLTSAPGAMLPSRDMGESALGLVTERPDPPRPASFSRKQTQDAPSLGPKHWQIDEPLDPEPAWQLALSRRFRPVGGKECKQKSHADQAFALVDPNGP